LAAVSIGVLAATGTLNSFLHVGKLGDLVGTSYGRTLGLKILLFLLVLGLGAMNHFVLRDRLKQAQAQEGSLEPARLFRKTIAAELVLALLLMGMTGLLVGLARTREVETAPDTGGAATVNRRP
jgi:putative copper export protein